MICTKLVLVRHGESEWNKENWFTGWTDVDLSAKDRQEAREAGAALRAGGVARQNLERIAGQLHV